MRLHRQDPTAVLNRSVEAESVGQNIDETPLETMNSMATTEVLILHSIEERPDSAYVTSPKELITVETLIEE